MSRSKKDFGSFEWIRIQDWDILARPKKGIAHVDAGGNLNGWVSMGGLWLSGNSHIDVKLGTIDVDMAKAMPSSLTTSDPLMHIWLLAGARIGETYMSYDRQPKLRGPKDVPVFVARIKRKDDFLDTAHYWRKWLKWRQAGARQPFADFVFGKFKINVERRSEDQACADTTYQIESRAARVKALTQRMHGEYGLSLDQDTASVTAKAIKSLGMVKTAP